VHSQCGTVGISGCHDLLVSACSDKNLLLVLTVVAKALTLFPCVVWPLIQD
jgi:hypothetical protein